MCQNLSQLIGNPNILFSGILLLLWILRLIKEEYFSGVTLYSNFLSLPQ